MNYLVTARLKATLFLILFVLTLSAAAQRLPNVQEAGLRAPENSRTDGKPTEWANGFQANNNHIQCYYSLANDDKNLYLVVKATEQEIVRRIMSGGITLTVITSGDKKDKNAARVTYPVFEPTNRFRPSFRPTGASPRTSAIGAVGVFTPAEGDSMRLAYNKALGDKAKNIVTRGLPGVDTMISVYNEEGIRAAGQFDNKLAYTCEFMIPLKYLGLSIDRPAKFIYQVRINEVMMSGILINGVAVSGIFNTSSIDPSTIKSISVGPNSQPGQAATDLWGEYLLVKQ